MQSAMRICFPSLPASRCGARPQSARFQLNFLHADEKLGGEKKWQHHQRKRRESLPYNCFGFIIRNLYNHRYYDFEIFFSVSSVINWEILNTLDVCINSFCQLLFESYQWLTFFNHLDLGVCKLGAVASQNLMLSTFGLAAGAKPSGYARWSSYLNIY